MFNQDVRKLNSNANVQTYYIRSALLLYQMEKLKLLGIYYLC